MNKQLSIAAKLAALVGAFALTGCAFVPDTVHPTYVPQANVQKIPGADKVTVDVIVKNEKKHKNEVSVTENGYGMSGAGVYMHVANDFKTAIETALHERGFNTGINGNPKVDVVVKEFFLHEHMHWWRITHTGNSVVKISVLSNAKPVFKDVVSINGLHSKIIGDLSHISLSADRHKSANGLLNETVDKLVDNPRFIKALLKSVS